MASRRRSLRAHPGHEAVAERLVVAERVAARWPRCVHNTVGWASRAGAAEPVLPEPVLPLARVLTRCVAHQTRFLPSSTNQLHISNPSCALSFAGPVHIPGLCHLQQRGKRWPWLELAHSSQQLFISGQGVAGVVVGTAASITPTVLLERWWLFLHDLLADLLLC